VSDLPPEQPPGPPEEPVAEPAAAAAEPGADHPIQVVVDDDLKRSRLTVFFRWILLIPQYFFLLFWSIAVFFVVIVAWFTALIKGRLPDRMHGYLARYLTYSTRLTAYAYLLANPYPPFNGRPETGYPVDLYVAPLEDQSRWKILFRWFLAIPAMILAWVFGQVLGIVAFLAWFVCLAIGRIPKGMRDLGVYCLRYQEQTYGYLLLLTERYPSLAGPTP
jgi:Domain of unknown function (DUF4389)